jgi:hypothetical protein
MEAHGMLFCKNCGNYLHLKNSQNGGSKDKGKGKEDGNNTKTKSKLIYYCKKCAYTYENKSKNKVTVYNVSYKTDSISKYLHNDYLKYDPTIPHLKSMSCINPSCASNLYSKYSINFQYNINPHNTTSRHLNTNLEQSLTTQFNNELTDMRTYGLIIKNIARNTYYVILTKTEEAGLTEQQSYELMEQIHTYISNMKMSIQKQKQKQTQTNNANVTDANDIQQVLIKNASQFTNVESIKKNVNDILFIKYDSVNMRYLYKCCVCSTCWKNKE